METKTGFHKFSSNYSSIGRGRWILTQNKILECMFHLFTAGKIGSSMEFQLEQSDLVKTTLKILKTLKSEK